MIALLGLIVGAVFGVVQARRHKGNRLDMAQYAAGYGILFAVVAMFAGIGLDRFVFS